MNQSLLDELKGILDGEVTDDEMTLTEYSHDASLFEVKPQVVVFPKDEDDVVALVNFVNKHKKEHPKLSLTGRSAGTDMGGGAINESIIVAFGKHFNHVPKIDGSIATTEPGVFYRDFELKTLEKNLLFPSYPASKGLCAMGGIFNNNSGGEKSLQYGKTEKYVRRMKVALSNGKIYEFKKLSKEELDKKMALKNFEGEVYRKMFRLIDENYETIKRAKPDVTKNSAGYFLWNIYDKENETFDLTQLFTGAQGTLGLFLEGDLELVPIKEHRGMIIVYLKSNAYLGRIIDEVLPLNPESFESYDDNTLMLALKYFPEFAKQLGPLGMISAGLAFLPAFVSLFTGRRLPKLVLQIDFASNNPDEIDEKLRTLREKIKPYHPFIQTADGGEEKKYWLVRSESFNLLRKKIRNKHTAPFI